MWTLNKLKNQTTFVYLLLLCGASPVEAEDLVLQGFIDEALKNNPEISAAQASVQASEHRIPQAKALPDPMVMVGYQNEGWDRITYGEMADAQLMFTGSQMFPFYGKRALRGEMAAQNAESLKADYQSLRLKTISRVKELYYDLFLAYQSRDIVESRTDLFSKIEDAALARYSSGMAPQQEVLMAQTEKYMLLERKEMYNQRIQALEAMLNTALGRSAVNAALPRPLEHAATEFPYTLEDLLQKSTETSPEIKSRERMIQGAQAGVKMAKKEYYPDVTVAGSVYPRGNGFEDMWSLTTQVNIPLFYRQKQRQGVLEAQATLARNEQELIATRLMLASGIRDNYSMFTTANVLMELYKEGLVPKTYQDFQAALAGYGTGRVEAITVISRLQSLLDYELLYWAQFVEREKAIARLEALAGMTELL